MRDKIFTVCLQFAIRKVVEDKEEVAVKKKSSFSVKCEAAVGDLGEHCPC